MKTLNLILVIAMVLSLWLAAGCGDSSTGPIEPKVEWGNPSSKIQGLWVFTGAYVDGTKASLSSALDWEYGSVLAAIQIEGDGTLYYAEFDKNYEVTMTGEGTVQTAKPPYQNKFRFNLINEAGDTYKISGTWSVSGDNLTLNGKYEGEAMKLTCERI